MNRPGDLAEGEGQVEAAPGPPADTADSSGAPARSPRRRAVAQSAGGLLAIAGAAVVFAYAPGVYPTASVLEVGVGGLVGAIAVLLIGASVQRLHELERDPMRLIASDHVGAASVVTGVACLAVALLLSFGVAPGFYLPSSGATHLSIGGCEGAGVASSTLAGSFPPLAHATIRWVSSFGYPLQVRIQQNRPDSARAAWQQTEDATAGAVAFISTGGAITVSSAVLSAGCPDPGSLAVNWSYSG